MTHQYYSQRTGSNPNLDGLPLGDITEMFSSLYGEMSEEGYFSEAFGYHCIDDGRVPGNVVNIDREILVTIRKRDLWPIYGRYVHYEEDDLLDMVEFLYQYVPMVVAECTGKRLEKTQGRKSFERKSIEY